MSTWARNIGGVAIDVTTMPPTSVFYPTLAAEFIIVPDGTVNGATYSDGVWTNPPAPIPPVKPAFRTLVTRAEFFMLFTGAERVAIRASTDPGVVDYMLVINDITSTPVDLTHPEVKAGLDYLVSKSLLTSDRETTILQGWPLP